MFFHELWLKCINIIQGKCCRKLIDAVPYIKKPASCRNTLFFQERSIMILLQYAAFFLLHPVFYNEYSSIWGNFGELYLASDPPCASCNVPQRLSGNNDSRMKEMSGSHKKVSHERGRRVIGQEKEIWVSLISDGFNHFLIITGKDRCGKVAIFRFLFVRCLTCWTEKVSDWCIVREMLEFIIAASWTIAVFNRPCFSQNPGFLRWTAKSRNICIKKQIHGRIFFLLEDWTKKKD